ncbi:hypothetical protein BU15DRAFT_74759 [Melanogaster broomeanus]|nr:hypothetical protein BU15DRAFT_74759 [Melanogaster broomeanus]
MAQSRNLRKINPDKNTGGFFEDDIKNNPKPLFSPLDYLPCANVEVDQLQTCENRGKSRCSACKLVSYCSQECQKKHWKIHKHGMQSTIIQEPLAATHPKQTVGLR